MGDFENIRLLLVENDADAADLIRKLIEKNFPADIDIADSISKAKIKLKDDNYDIIMMDLILPDGDGLKLTEEITSSKDHPQVIIVTGHGSEEIAAQAFESGAAGYVPKGDELFRRIPQSLQQAIAELRRKEAAIAVRERETFFRSLFSESMTPLFIMTIEGVVEDVNGAVCELFGFSAEELKGNTIEHLIVSNRRMEFERVFAQIGLGDTIQIDCVHRNGDIVPAELSGKIITTRKGEQLLVTLRDLSRWKKIEAALHNVIKETNERREEISALLESTRLVLEKKDFQSAAKAVFDLCKKLIGAQIGFLALLGAGKEETRVLFMSPKTMLSDSDSLVKLSLSACDSPAFKNGRAEIINEFFALEGGKERGEELIAIDNMLVAPLVVDQEIPGLIALANRAGGFSKENGLMASAFGEIISLAFRNSLTLEMLQDSEKRFRSVAQNADEALICADSKMRIFFWNTAAQRIFGYTPAEILNRELDLIIPERFRGEELYTIMQLTGNGKTDTLGKAFELTGLRKDGIEFPIELSRSIWNVQNELFHTVIIRDITERKEAEKALSDSEDLFKSLMLASPDAILVTSDEGNVTHASLRAAEMFHFNHIDELLGRDYFELVAPEDLKHALSVIEDTRERRVIRNIELTMIRKDSSRFIGDVSTALIEKGNGSQKSFVVNVRDVTARKKAERELQILNIELENYAHVVSHDLKVPLSSINAANVTLETLFEKDDCESNAEDIRQMTEIIRNSVKKADSLIENLLMLAKTGQQPTNIVEVDIRSVIDDIVREQSEIIKKKGIRVDVDSRLGAILANNTHIYQLLSNLIVNSIRHNDSEHPVITISNLGEENTSIHHFLVRDNGSGFDPDYLQSMFMPLSVDFNGNRGIGLAIVEKIINVYDGVITAYNDNGACIDFMIKDAV